MIKSSFFEFSVASSGLRTAQANMQIASHNIANASTRGYSRQYGLQSATTPMGYYDGRGMYGTGSDVYGVRQVRDPYLDKKYWDRSGTLGEYSIKYTQMTTLEYVFNGIGGSGINGAMNDMFGTLQELSTNPGDLTFRNNFISQADSMIELLATMGSELEKQQFDLNQEVKMTVDRINSIGKQIASLNEEIRSYEMSGDVANDLRDQRALLVDELSGYVNIEVDEIEMNEDYNPNDPTSGVSDKRFIVKINGYDFVNGEDVNLLECVPREDKLNPNDADGLYDIYFMNSGVKFDIYSDSLEGELKGLIDVRDGNNNRHVVSPNEFGEVFEDTTEYKGIPHYQDKINQLIRGMARAFNEGVDFQGNPIDGVTGHIYGYDLYGNNGNVLFTYTDEAGNTINTVDPSDPSTFIDYSEINYSNFTVNTDMLNDPSLVSASSDPTLGDSDGTVILGFLGLYKDDSVFAEGSLEDFIKGISVEIGISVDQARKYEAMYEENVMLVENQRMSVSGVDINQEMMLMIQYQQQYNASAKLISVIDEIYNTMINGLGI